MDRTVMSYIVFDLEWNQAESLLEEKDLHFEIVEIGAVKLNEKLEIVDRFSQLISPSVYSKLNPVTSQVIHLTDGELANQGRPFTEVIKEFFKWCGEDPFFCTWGTMDLSELQKNIDFYGVENPFPKPLYYYDIQKWYSLFYEDGRIRRSLEFAVDSLVIEQNEPYHRACSDAYYTARVMQTMDLEALKPYVSIDYHQLPQNRREEIYHIFSNYSKFISRVFETREDAMQNPQVTSMVCFLCGKSASYRAKWFSVYGKNYYALGYCPVHGYLKGKIRFKKPENKEAGFFVVKTIKRVGSEEAKGILERREALRDKRRGRHQESDEE
ncbi:MAG: exonuclease domain-containing protein [Lachnospiraceae bacterium]